MSVVGSLNFRSLDKSATHLANLCSLQPFVLEELCVHSAGRVLQCYHGGAVDFLCYASEQFVSPATQQQPDQKLLPHRERLDEVPNLVECCFQLVVRWLVVVLEQHGFLVPRSRALIPILQK